MTAGQEKTASREKMAGQAAVGRRPAPSPTLAFERSFTVGGHRFVAGCDEVGRGALAGPVSVGIVVVDASAVRALKGVRDSKLLSARDREALVPKIRLWALAHAVGHASSREIDEQGLMAALRLAGTRAWCRVLETVRPDVVILDGNHNWLSPAQASLFEPDTGDGGCDAPVVTRIKADLQCLSVAAASVLAKVERDAIMTALALEHPGYGWDINKGYATESHRRAIAGQGPSPQHRLSWRLTGPLEAGPGGGVPGDAMGEEGTADAIDNTVGGMMEA